MIIVCILVALAIAFLIALAVPSDVLAAGGAIILMVIMTIGLLALSFFVTAGIVWLICWAFSLTFSWKIAFGIWLVLVILRSIFKNTKD